VTEPIILSEYGAQMSVPIPAEDAAILGRTQALTVLPSMTHSGAWDLAASHYVGVVQAGQTEVRITPKVPMRNLLFLLGYARDPSGWREIEALFEEVEDLVPALATAFEFQTRRALRQGVLKGYVTLDEALPLVRGRIRSSDQMVRRRGVPLPVELTFDEFSPDILENRMLLTATRVLLGLHGLPPFLRPRLKHLASRFDGVTSLAVRRPVPTVVFTRLNERYRAALTLAALILQGRATGDEVGTRQAVSFLFDMNRVFEDFMTAALSPHLTDRGVRVEAQSANYLDEAGKISIRPDLSWWSGPRCLGVADIKYKSLSLADLPNPDVYQLLAYCVAYTVPKGFLIYAAGNEVPDLHRVRNLGVEIEVVAVDLGLRPAPLIASLETLASRIMAGEQTQILSA
jgi:5-methylcytosine-specific restriction enzyme subunit McrC